jgi:hypothetical protein
MNFKNFIERFIVWNTNNCKKEAKFEYTSPERLEQLSHHSSDFVRAYVAGNPNTSITTLNKLSRDRDWFVRTYVAQNIKTSADVLYNLAQDDCESLRRWVSWHPNTPPKAKELLNAIDFLEKNVL